MVAVFAMHLVVIVAAGQHGIAASRLCTAALVAVAGLCAFRRAWLLPWPERPTWLWGGSGILLWAVAHAVETFVGHSAAGSVLTVDASDFIYVCAIFPLLMAFAATRETQSLRAVFLLNCAQIGLALVLAWFMLYRMSMSPALSETVMGRIYGAACALLAVMSLLRSLCWITPEERQTLRWISVFLWTYLPIELGMDYLTQYRGLRAGTMLDLAWSVPFGLAGWSALNLPLGWEAADGRRHMGRVRLLVECACPLLLNAGIFVLAAAVMRQHIVLGLVAVASLLLIQGLQAALVQTNYLSGRLLLLDRELELRTANAALERLALRDALTGIANRRCFDAQFEAAWRSAARRREPLALLLVDVDYFKGVNDRHGHTYGDECLRSLAQVMDLQARRPGDLVARLGGEEFVFLLPDTDEGGAVALAVHLQAAIQDLAIVNEASPFDLRLTVSVGLAVWFPASGMGKAALMEAADKALYQAKNRGRNLISSILLREAEPAGLPDR
jgi:diguanylate cyclase (GGDEF)-like protein